MASRKLYAGIGAGGVASLAFVVFGAPASMAQDSAVRSLTAVEMIEQPTFPPFHDLSHSPNGDKFLITTVRGDSARNGVWLTFFAGSTLDRSAASPREVARVFARAYGQTPVTLENDIRWTSNDDITFLWEDNAGIVQVHGLTISTGEVVQLTDVISGVLQYATSSDWRRILFTTSSRLSTGALSLREHAGFAVASTNALELFPGHVDAWWTHVSLHLLDRDASTQHEIAIPSGYSVWWSFSGMQIAANGEIALLELWAIDPPNEWVAYDSEYVRSALQEADGVRASRLATLFSLDLDQRSLTSVANAPHNPSARIVFSSQGDEFVVGPIFLNLSETGEAARKGEAVIVVNPRTRRFEQIQVPANTGNWHPTVWSEEQIVLAQLGSDEVLTVAHQGHRWEVLDGAPPILRRAVSVELRQTLNASPALLASDGVSESVVWHRNPDIDSYLLATVRIVNWHDSNGRRWTGRLYTPRVARPLAGYPLVIQLKECSNSEFSLNGCDAYPSTFAAQPLAARGIATLQIGEPEGGYGELSTSPDEPRIAMNGVEAAIRYLEGVGEVDASRVGLSGFSRTGWYIEFILTHSDLPFSAALAADHMTASYFQSVFLGHPREYSFNVGGAWSGAEIARWLEHSPGFNADRIRVPLRLQAQVGGSVAALGYWEIFANMKALNLPVELYVVPQGNLAGHNLQNPRQRLASVQGAVDWFDFWLNGVERAEPSVVDQYLRWQALKEQALAANSRPRRPLMTWTSAPSQ